MLTCPECRREPHRGFRSKVVVGDRIYRTEEVDWKYCPFCGVGLEA